MIADIDIVTPWEEEMLRQGKPYIAARNNASSIGYPCERNLVYRRTHLSAPKSLEALERMIEGTKQHEAVRAYLRYIGFVLTEDEHPLYEAKYQLSGHIEGMIFDVNKTKTKIPYEIKTCDPYIFDSLKTLEDFDKGIWTKTWIDQCHTYMFLREYEFLKLVIKNRKIWKPKQFLVELDYQRAEELLQKTERINKHLENKTYPDRIKYDPNLCGRCDYQYICLPTIQIKSETLNLDNDDTFIEMVEQHEELKESYSTYNSLHKQIKALVTAYDKPIIKAGGFLIKNDKKMKIDRL